MNRQYSYLILVICNHIEKTSINGITKNILLQNDTTAVITAVMSWLWKSWIKHCLNSFLFLGWPFADGIMQRAGITTKAIDIWTLTPLSNAGCSWQALWLEPDPSMYTYTTIRMRIHRLLHKHSYTHIEVIGRQQAKCWLHRRTFNNLLRLFMFNNFEYEPRANMFHVLIYTQR